MQIPQFTGEPLAVYSRITQEDAPIHLYHYSYKQVPLQGNLDTINKLTEQGYERVVGKDLVESGLYTACLFSQLFDVIYVRDGEHFSPWSHYKSIEYVKKYPVCLAFKLDDPSPENEPFLRLEHIQMLQFLPLPRHGEFAMTGPGQNAALYTHHDLGKKGTDLKIKLGDAIIALAGGTQWGTYNEVHRLCASELQYMAIKQNLQTDILNTRGKVRKEAQENLTKLERSHQDVVALRQSWLRPDWLVQWQEIRHMAQELARTYYEHHEAEIKKNKPVPQVANVFSSGCADIYNALPFHAFPAATIAKKAQHKDGQWVGGDWKQEVGKMENELVLSYQFKRAGETYVQIREEATDTTSEQVLANMWKQSTMYSDLDSDVYLARLAQLMNGQKDEQGNTWITGQQILAYRGIKPKRNIGDIDGQYTGGPHWEELEKIAACMSRQQNISIKIAEMEIIDNPTGKRRRSSTKRSISRESPLFMNGDIIYHNTLPLNGPSKSIAIAWQYRESSWMTPFLTGPNRYTTKLIQTVLNYDPYHQQWEKRLSKYFMWWLRANASKDDKHKPKLYIAKLLEELNLPITYDRPQRTLNRFEEAMNQIAKDNLLQWRYSEDIELPARKWFPTWLQQQIVVEDPPLLKASHSIIESRAKAIRAENQAQKQLERQRKTKKKEQN